MGCAVCGHPLPELYEYSIRRHGHQVVIVMSPGYDRKVVMSHASRHRPKEELPAIREALGLTEPSPPTEAALEAS
ncbi:hypothetical protein FHS43_003958 [Streptosporangium becharense]|uniref:Uncharacterized protein n=1 Tax=Streptosporangium becharense TaxID=1816182 RepID=A0A7W9MHE9_9ACTN|nr:hypothetical protein [Streptosporangium becharense]MBB5820496.1 hypothetical protein [Streptosporangium becharense]